MYAIPPTLALPLKGGGKLHSMAMEIPLPLDGGGWGGGDTQALESRY